MAVGLYCQGLGYNTAWAATVDEANGGYKWNDLLLLHFAFQFLLKKIL